MSNTSPYYQRSRKEMTLFLPKHYVKVLEIGCSEGKFRKNLKQEHEYWGVEPVESAAKIASKRLDKVLIGTYEETLSQIPKDYFDLVVCNDVIEHMVDHDKFLQSIKEKITKDGYLVASIPNVRYLPNIFEILVKKNWEYKNEGILDRTHLRFFTRKSIYKTMNQHGFVIEQIRGINPCLSNSILKRCISCFCTLLFGKDVKFLQFGIRVKIDRNEKIKVGTGY